MISPYLNRPTRTLEDACEQLHCNHGGKKWACTDCEFREICPLAGKVGTVLAFKRPTHRQTRYGPCRVTQSDE
jgi:hypothetical protein